MNVISDIVKSVSRTEMWAICFMRPLKDVLPANANNVLYVFYDFETTQNKSYSDTAKEHVPNLVCGNSFVRDVRKRKTSTGVNDVAGGGTLFGMIL
jgi:hypothetical protein